MGRKPQVMMYRIHASEKSHRYARIVKSGRGWTSKSQPSGEPGAYYLRYLKNRRGRFESVGHDIQVALQEQKAHQIALSAPASVTISSLRKTFREEANEFLTDKAEALRYIPGGQIGQASPNAEKLFGTPDDIPPQLRAG